jgi:hypothetical protein
MREKEMNKKYFKEFWIAMGSYMIILFGTTYLAKGMPESVMRTMIALTPIVPCVGLLWVVIRHFKRMDEYLRIWVLENLSIAGGVLTMFSITYGFLEGLDFPRASGFVYYSVYLLSWGVITCVRKFLER